MMSNELLALTITAFSIAVFHTLLGPDHYVPFIAMSRARKWSIIKTLWITTLCGLGHIAGSVILGIIGIALGISVSKLEKTESFRGEIAAWFLIAFGIVYFIWGLRKTIRNREHTHKHGHGDGSDHIHCHTHKKNHLHIHFDEKAKNITPWILFAIFFLGPCEPLIPILMYPAAKSSVFGLALITGVFGAITIVIMLGVVLIASLGVNLLPQGRLEQHSHALAGVTLFLCGVTIQFLGV